MTAKRLHMLAAVGLLMAALILPYGCAKEEETEGQEQKIEDIQLEEAFALMEDHRGSDDFVIIDLRSAEEYASGYIEDAVNLDYSTPDFADMGFMKVYNMLGGMENWEEIGLPKVQ
jgi:3-mercaptopyruvate sulfurtransferase SseA